MSIGRRGGLRYAAVFGLIAVYACLSHYCNSVGAGALGTPLALAPLTLLTLLLAWRSLPPVTASLVSALVAMAIYRLWPLLERNFTLIYCIGDSGSYALLGATFGRSLTGGRTALCSRLADRLHGPLSSAEKRYTRHVTLAWAVFFWMIAALSIFLYNAAPLRLWSLYVNFCVVPLIVLMFAAEYAVRRRVLPQVPRVGVLAALRVYLASAQ